MGRMRVIKPEFFKHEVLFDLERQSGLPVRLAFIGLWTQCDREGRFRWLPRRLKVEIMPYDHHDFDAILEALAGAGFIVKYQHDGDQFGYVPKFHRHQMPHHREKPSEIPAPKGLGCTEHASGMHQPCTEHASSMDGRTKSLDVLRESVLTGICINGNRESELSPEVAPLAPGRPLSRSEGISENDCPEVIAESLETPAKDVEPQNPESVEACAQAAGNDDPVVLTFPCSGPKTQPDHWHLRKSKLAEYEESYPGVDVLVECRKALQWCRDNPKRTKTAQGTPAYLSRWLSKAQDGSRAPPQNRSPTFTQAETFAQKVERIEREKNG